MSYGGFDISRWKHGRVTGMRVGGEDRSTVVEAATLEIEYVDGRFDEVTVEFDDDTMSTATLTNLVRFLNNRAERA